LYSLGRAFFYSIDVFGGISDTKESAIMEPSKVRKKMQTKGDDNKKKIKK